MLKVTATYDETSAARIRLKLTQLRNADWMRAALEESADYLVRMTHKAIDRGVDIEGKAFKPLTEKYVARPRNKGGRGGDRTPILSRTGEMMASVMRDEVTGSGMRQSIIIKPSSTSMAERGAYHQFPKTESPPSMPRRAFIGIRKDDPKRIKAIFRRYANMVISK